MTTGAHLLLQTDPGRAEDVVAHLGQLEGVSEAAVTSGPYDVIALLHPDVDVPHALAQVKRAPGLSRLCVCRPA